MAAWAKWCVEQAGKALSDVTPGQLITAFKRGKVENGTSVLKLRRVVAQQGGCIWIPVGSG
eukprot:12007879-Alexandrium_andersonii.AAC.1